MLFNIITKQDCRGIHWKEKISKGIAPPTPWKLTQFWANFRSKLEEKFLELASKNNWTYRPWVDDKIIRGNQFKCLWMQLMIFKWQEIVKIEFKQKEGFMGILKVIVPNDKCKIFNKDMFPSMKNFKTSDTNYPFHYKTLVKIWHTAGFIESITNNNDYIFEYNSYIYESHAKTNLKAENNRKQKRILKTIKTTKTIETIKIIETTKTTKTIETTKITIDSLLNPEPKITLESAVERIESANKKVNDALYEYKLAYDAFLKV